MRIGAGKRNNNSIHFLFLFVVVLLTGCREKSAPALFGFSGNTMGTTYSVKVPANNPAISAKKYKNLQAGVDSVLLNVNRQMSTYLKDSQISMFNKTAANTWYSVSADLVSVVEKALIISQKSGGAYDITVGPLVNLWGFGPEKKERRMPSDQEIAHRRKWTGFQKLALRHESPALKKSEAQLYCDLSSIAKGFGVDKVASFLQAVGFTNYMIEIGGEVRTAGKNNQLEKWKIGIASPIAEIGIEKIIAVSNFSMATSGDYQNYFEENGRRFSHTIDPRTGRPVTHKLASVTVMHPECVWADGYATAIDVLGPKAGYDFALKNELPVFMIIKDGDGFVEKMTPSFKKYLVANSKGN